MESNRHTKSASGGASDEQVAQSAIDGAEVRDIPIERITVGEFCCRSSYDDLDPLVRSIDQNGLLQPGGVLENADGTYTLIFGSRRLEAHKRLGRTTFRCQVIHATPEQAAILSFTENSSTEAMHPVEQAKKLQLMQNTFGWTEQEIAKEIGWNQSSVSEYLGILDLGEDLLAKIDTRRESPFRFTHAQALSKLMRTKRLSRFVEVQQLFNKTIRHSLPCSELKMLVQLFTKGSYDHLPDRLRAYLLTSETMTSAMARLFLEPESVIECEGNDVDQRRKTVRDLGKGQIEDLIVKAVKGRWPFAKTRQKLLDLVNRELGPLGQKKEVKTELSHQLLCDDISNTYKRLDVCNSELKHIAESHPNQLQRLCDEVEKFRAKLEEFSVSARRALAVRETRITT